MLIPIISTTARRLEVREARLGRLMPAQKPGLSKQDYATPPEFIDAVKRRFGIREFAYDLAASKENTKAKHFFCEEQDSLKQDWPRAITESGRSHVGPAWAWLNPPYAHIAPWAEKCAASAHIRSGRRILFLVPAAVGANWFAQHVDGQALVLLLNGRISFDGKAPYPKDCILVGYGLEPGYEVWSWAKGSK
jgi:phage N-6-adenine-methyltransferase